MKFAAAEAAATRTKVSVQAKNEAIKAMKKALRAFVKEYLTYNHLVTNEDRDSLGLPIYKEGRTSAPVPGTYPVFTIDSSTIRILRILFQDQMGLSRAKPAGVHGAEIRWELSETPVVNPGDLRHSAFDTRTPFTLEFNGDERGKTVWFCLRWENNKGEKGPWSEIVSAIVP